MNEQLEFKGFWFLPNYPENRVAGILTYIPHETIKLELIGYFESEKSFIDSISDHNKIDIILGNASNGKKITIIYCIPSSSYNSESDFPITTYECTYLIIGKHLNDIFENCFNRATVLFSELKYWCLPNAIIEMMKYNKNEELNKVSFLINTKNKRIINSTIIDDNTTLSLKECIVYFEPECYFDKSLNQYTSLEISKKEASSIKDFMKDIYLYEQFLSFATLRRVICSNIQLTDQNCNQEICNPIQFIYIHREFDNNAQPKRYQFLFDYEKIKSQYSYIIRKWYTEDDDIVPIRQHLIDSIKVTKVFSSVDFLIVEQAIEGFWWRFRDRDYKSNNKNNDSVSKKTNTSLKEIFEELISEFASVTKIANLNLNIDSVVDSRHYYSHFMNKKNKRNIADGLELFYLSRKLKVILICCMMNFMGLSNIQINDILEKSYNTIFENILKDN